MKLLSSLTNRIFLTTALVAVLSIGVAIYLVNVAVTSQAEEELQRGLEEAATLVDHHRTLLFDHFTREARLIADLPKLKAAVETDHAPTVAPLADDYQRQIGSDLFVVTNTRGQVLAEIGRSEVTAEQVPTVPAVQAALRGQTATSFWPRDGGVLQTVSVPIWIDPSQPEILGTLSVGFSLDERTAVRFKEITNSEIAFAVDGRIQAATLAAAEAEQLAGLLAEGKISRIVLGDEEYEAVARSLSPGGNPGDGRASANTAASGAVGADVADAPVAVILRSRTEHLRFLRSLQTALAGTALVALLAATLLSYGVARTITRPLGAMTTTMRAMAADGDLTRKVALPHPGGWDDEDTRLLATTFNTMTESIARFQREASQRERLSSLGRLSTIVAHEIRNPLMIIKTSLRTLRRQEAQPDRVQAAISDIDEEIGRLNRVVSEVLDFARPIRFDLAPVDVNVLCREAAGASAAGEEWPTVRLSLAPEVTDLVTDRERLRLTLINILTNARHAVSARPGGPQVDHANRSVPRVHDANVGRPIADHDGPDIELTTRPLGDARILIEIRDRGVGIEPDDLPRVFDPYFTTKRTGSGLGLAIAKNIIEGLGGTIVVRSRVGEGTEMRVELPREGARK